MQIELQDDPPPIVRMLGVTLRRSAADPKLGPTLAKMRGVAALRSATDPQAATLRFERGAVRIEAGVAPDATVVIEADLATMNDPEPPKPKVTGAARHPQFALALGKVLDPPRAPWPDEARAFWQFAAGHRGMPTAVRVVCTDRAEVVELGEGAPECELHGTAHRLGVALSGSSVLGEDILAEHLAFVGELRHVAVLTGRSIAYAMGGPR